MKSIVENKIVLNGKPFDYIIEYKNIKNIYFRVKEDLKIHISVNVKVPKEYIIDLLNKESSTIIKMYNNMQKKNVSNQNILYLGNKLILNEYEKSPYINNDYIYAKDEVSAKEYIYNLAYDVFLERIERIKNLYRDLPNFKLKVRKMKSKWGVCNIRSMSVTLNTELITKDVHLIDYVIIHELCHFKHMDHSPSFWKDVSKYYPYYKEARKELNSYD